jgi:hypothetical protein
MTRIFAFEQRMNEKRKHEQCQKSDKKISQVFNKKR